MEERKKKKDKDKDKDSICEINFINSYKYLRVFFRFFSIFVMFLLNNKGVRLISMLLIN